MYKIITQTQTLCPVQIPFPGGEPTEPMAHVGWRIPAGSPCSGGRELCQPEQDQLSTQSIPGLSGQGFSPLPALRKWNQTTKSLLCSLLLSLCFLAQNPLFRLIKTSPFCLLWQMFRCVCFLFHQKNVKFFFFFLKRGWCLCCRVKVPWFSSAPQVFCLGIYEIFH